MGLVLSIRLGAMRAVSSKIRVRIIKHPVLAVRKLNVVKALVYAEGLFQGRVETFNYY